MLPSIKLIDGYGVMLVKVRHKAEAASKFQGILTGSLVGQFGISIRAAEGVLPLYNVGYIAAGTPKSLTFSQN